MNILCEAIHHMAQTSPIPRDLINILTTGFPEADLPGLTTADIVELLGVMNLQCLMLEMIPTTS